MINNIVSITQTAESVPFENDTNGFEATNVQAAIEEISATSGFHYKTIPINKRVTIPVDFQMIVKQYLRVNGQIVVQGELVII